MKQVTGSNNDGADFSISTKVSHGNSVRLLSMMVMLILFISLRASHGGSATWNQNPVNDDWFDPMNWTPMSPPNSQTDIATFGVSNTTIILLTASTSLDTTVMLAGASSFTLKPESELDFYGAGVTNNSMVVQTLENDVYPGIFGLPFGSRIMFYGTATAGNNTMFINSNGGSPSVGGDYTFLGFLDTSSAGTAMIINDGSSEGDENGGVTSFGGSSTAANSTIINNGSSAKIGGIDPVGAYTDFTESSTTGNATLIANTGSNGGPGGVIEIASNASGGKPRVELHGNGLLIIDSGVNTTLGSLEGNGIVELAVAGASPSNLSIGANNLSTTFSGRLEGMGSLKKTGKGKLTLSKASTYTGGTTVTLGSLLITNKTGSATGTGPVTVVGGTFGGTGIISGAVTIASAAKRGILAPGSGEKLGTLTLSNTLTFNARATCKINLNSATLAADSVSANGVTIMSGAGIDLSDSGNSTLPAGTVFIIINNTSATPTSGAFANLADGATITLGNNTYKASYEGGDGNDLTLTVQ